MTLCKHSQYRHLVYFCICIFSIFSFWYLWWLEQCEVGCECIAGWGPSSQVRPFHASGGAEWMVCAKIVTSIAQHKWGLVCQTCQTCPPSSVCTALLPAKLSPVNNNSRCMHYCTALSVAPKVLDSPKVFQIPHTLLSISPTLEQKFVLQALQSNWDVQGIEYSPTCLFVC